MVFRFRIRRKLLRENRRIEKKYMREKEKFTLFNNEANPVNKNSQVHGLNDEEQYSRSNIKEFFMKRKRGENDGNDK